MAHALHEAMPLAATTAAKAPHDLGELLCQGLGVALAGRRPAAALLDDVVDDRERFFCAFYSVVASVTR